MLKRIRKAMEEKDQGFTLIELLVVMIIIGILAAIAIPVFLNQRQKAQDTAVKSDVGILGKEISTWYIDNSTIPTITQTGGQYTVGATTNTVGRYSNGVQIVTSVGTLASGGTPTGLGTTTTTASQTGWTASTWCIALYNANGSAKTYKYSAQNGLEQGQCTTASTP